MAGAVRGGGVLRDGGGGPRAPGGRGDLRPPGGGVEEVRPAELEPLQRQEPVAAAGGTLSNWWNGVLPRSHALV